MVGPGDEIGGALGHLRHIALRSDESVSLQNSSYSAPGHAVAECPLFAHSRHSVGYQAVDFDR